MPSALRTAMVLIMGACAAERPPPIPASQVFGDGRSSAGASADPHLDELVEATQAFVRSGSTPSGPLVAGAMEALAESVGELPTASAAEVRKDVLSTARWLRTGPGGAEGAQAIRAGLEATVEGLRDATPPTAPPDYPQSLEVLASRVADIDAGAPLSDQLSATKVAVCAAARVTIALSGGDQSLDCGITEVTTIEGAGPVTPLPEATAATATPVSSQAPGPPRIEETTGEPRLEETTGEAQGEGERR